jgi:hypothetical protein
MRMLEVSKNSIEPLLKASPELAQRIAASMAARQKQLDELARGPEPAQDQEEYLLRRIVTFFFGRAATDSPTLRARRE